MSYPDIAEINKESDMIPSNGEGQLSFGKLLLLGLFAVVLSSFGPLSFFASVPLTMGILLFGRMKTFFMVLVLSAALFTMTVQFNLPFILGAILLTSYFYAVLYGEVFLRKLHPVRGMFISGAIVMAILFAVLAGGLLTGVDLVAELKTSVVQTLEIVKENNGEMLAQQGEQARVLEDMLNNPDMVVQQILNWAASAVFVGNYFVIWACLFVLLRNSLFWRIKHAYPYSIKDMVRFKVPEKLVWPFIAALGLTVGGDYLFGEIGSIIGANLMYCLGVFYFFQGVGIYLDFLTFVRIKGIFRSLLVIFTISMAWRLIAVIGIFDFWVNFRRFFKKNSKQ